MKAHSVGYFKSPKESPQIEDAIKTLLDDSPRGCSPLLPDYNWIIRAELNFLRRQRLMNSSSKLLELRKITTTAWGGGVIRRLSHMHFIFHRIAFRNNYAKTKARETKKKAHFLPEFHYEVKGWKSCDGNASRTGTLFTFRQMMLSGLNWNGCRERVRGRQSFFAFLRLLVFIK